MKRLNSTTTLLNKRLFPAVCFGVLAMLAVGVVSGAIRQGDPSSLLALPFFVLFGGFGYLIMRWLILDLVDEVWDEGNSLLIRNRGQEVRIPLGGILNVSYSGFQNPPRVTLYLREATALGSEIAFITPIRVFSFRMPPETRELMQRVDEARRNERPLPAEPQDRLG